MVVNDNASSNLSEEGEKSSTMQQALQRLTQQKEDLEIALSTAVEHGDMVEEQLNTVNEDLSREVQERKRAELTLKEVIATITRQKEDLEIALSTAIDHGDAIEAQLHEVNKELNENLGARKEVESRLQAMVKALNRQKSDLELLVDTVASHGDQINDQMHEHLSSIELLARADCLTGLSNRRAFDEIFEREWQRAKRNHTVLSLLILDVDHFKGFNDEFGHASGDECLVRVAKSLTSLARRGSDTVARYGGEEFVILLPDCSVEEANNIAEKAREGVSKLAIKSPQSTTGYVTVSVGVASCLPESDNNRDELFKTADERLYEAKRSGRNRVCVAK